MRCLAFRKRLNIISEGRERCQMRYYISDLHFFHENMNTKMDKRGFESVEAMNEYMISQWNKKVRKNDEVVILGDLSIEKGERTNEVLRRLNGRKYLVIGNHDRYLKDKAFDKSLFKAVESYMELNDNKRKIILSHYPIFCYDGQYRVDENGNPKTYMLYGHVHNTYDEILVNHFQKLTRQQSRLVYHAEAARPIPCNMINCFCMFSDYVPLTLEEWIVVDAKRRTTLPAPEDYDDTWLDVMEKSEEILNQNIEAYAMLAMDETVENYKKGRVSDSIDNSDIDEVAASLRLDGFEITPEDIEILKKIKSSIISF